MAGVEWVIAAVQQYSYGAIFVGLIFGGETILLPIIYYSLQGMFNLTYVLIAAISATIISDAIWYAIGRGLIKGFGRMKINPRIERHIVKMDHLFADNALKALFISKFVYGTRIAAQVLSGMNKVPIKHYFLVNILGILSLSAFYVLAISLFASSVPSTDLINKFRITLIVSVVGVFVLQWLISHIIKRIWFR